MQPVYNLEVHGEHVYEVTQAGVLVHNNTPDCVRLAALQNKLNADGFLEDADASEYLRLKESLGVAPNSATVGTSTSTNYKKTFFDAYPNLEGKVVVHHGIEQQVLDLYPGRFTPAEIHSLENLRGIPKTINSDLHLSKIRKEWNRFYLNNPNATRQQILDEATRIDHLFGNQFDPPL